MATSPIRFEVLVNGKPFATSGVGNDYGVLTAVVNWVRRSPAAISEKARSMDGFDEAAFLAESCGLDLSALDSGVKQHSSWEHRALAVGDVVTIRILPGGEYDPPTTTA